MAEFDGLGSLGVVKLLRPGPIEDWDDFFTKTKSMLRYTFDSGEGLPADLLLSSAVGMQEDLERVIQITPERVTPELLRQFLPMEKFPFLRLKHHTDTVTGLSVHLLPRDSILRQCYQVIFLKLLRRYIPEKYESIDLFLEAYPDFIDRSLVEQKNLKTTAEWIHVSFFTLGPVNNKGFIIGLIPRLVEGAGSRYVTGSGETLQTRDRVTVFCTEGNFDKPKRIGKRARMANTNAIDAKTISLFSEEASENIAAFMLSRMGTPRSYAKSSLASPQDSESLTAETNSKQPRHFESSGNPSEQAPYPVRIERPLSSSDLTSVSASSGFLSSSPTIPTSSTWLDPDNNLDEDQFLVFHNGPIRLRARGKDKSKGRKGRGKGVASSIISNLPFIVSASKVFCEDVVEKRDEATDVAEQLLRLRLSFVPHENAALVDSADMIADCS